MSGSAASAHDGAQRVANAAPVATDAALAAPERACAAPDLSPSAIEARHRGENFPVVLRGLPRGLREALLALYGFARLVDEVGDSAPGDRRARLDALSRDLERIRDGEPRDPIVQRLAPVVRRHALPIATLERLVEANRRDQALGRIESWGALVDSCGYSANPVGELVLGLFGVADERSIQLSDAICTGLQVVEHCQDVREDFERGRIYLPAEDMARLGCGASDLAASKASAALVETVRLQVGRARALFRSADPLLARLRGAAVPLVAGYAAGGLATCDALERQGFDVLAHAVRPARRDVLRHATRLVGRTWLVGARRGRTGRDR